MSDSAPLSAAVVGATGVVGRALLPILAADPRFAPVRAAVRRPLDVHGVATAVVDFTDDAAIQRALSADVFFCALGTTQAKSGKDGLAAVDRDLVLRCARLAHAGGAHTAVVVSSLGASPTSLSFYSRIKGEMEAGMAEIGFESVQILRPSLLLGDREESRPGESIGKAIAPVLGPLLPKRMRGIYPGTVAGAMRDVAVGVEVGVVVRYLPLDG